MIYNYYMKKFLFIITALILFPVCLFCAQATVVRVDKNLIYLDTSELETPVAEGDIFKVILSTEKLVNPKTGKELGEVNNYSEEGRISEIKELFAVGKLENAAPVKAGMDAVLEKPAAQIPQKAALSESVPQPADVTHAKQTYDPIQKTVLSISSGNVTAPDADNFILLSEDNEISVWERAADDTLNLLLTYPLPKGKQGITVSAVPVKENHFAAQIFVSVFDSKKNSFSTLVLENQDGKLVQTATLPYFTKELGCGAQKAAWAQRTFVIADKPGNAHQIVFKDGKYTLGENNFSTQRNWLTGVNYFDIEGKDSPNLIYTSPNGALRMILSNGKRTESPTVFAATPNRLQYKQNILKFYPSLQVTGSAGNAQIVAVEHTTKLGLLSSTFGQYKNAVLHWLSYQKGRLELQEKVELAGVVYDTACSDKFILAAEVLPDGTSSIVEISK